MMAKTTFLGAVSRQGGSYSIVFLDIPGCASCGHTLEEVLDMGKEALEGHIGVAADYGDPMPKPSEHTLADVERWLFDDQDDAEADGTWIGLYPIEVTVPEKRNTVSLRVDADLMNRIAELSRVMARQIDSARFIEEAIEHEIERYRKSA